MIHNKRVFIYLKKACKFPLVTSHSCILFSSDHRLTPPYMFVLVFFNNIFPHLITGPKSPQVLENNGGGLCDKYWWTNLLYINNFHPTFNKQVYRFLFLLFLYKVLWYGISSVKSPGPQGDPKEPRDQCCNTSSIVWSVQTETEISDSKTS